jgi:hypothetical protein
MSPVGAITHRGSPIQFGGEKEFNLEGLSGNKLEHTEPEALKPELLAQIAGDKQWAQLTDAEKARYSLEHKKLTGEFPVLRVKPNNDYVATDFEPNGWVEVISKRFDSPAEIRTFLDKFGWGHIHTSFMRGAPPEEQAQQVAWTCNANLYMFLSSLERRGGTDLWPFAIKGLSVPTEDHLEYFARILRGEELRTTAFSKHLMLNIRSGTKYGERNRIGGETRGGVQNEKERVLDSLLTGLTDGAWGRSPQKWGEGNFKLVKVGSDASQVASLPRDFQTLLGAHPDAAKLYTFVAQAQLLPNPQPARMQKFDQRACMPLLRYEELPWLSDAAKQRVVAARDRFIAGLAEASQKQYAGPTDSAQAIAGLIYRWAADARLAEELGGWLDGEKRQFHFR